MQKQNSVNTPPQRGRKYKGVYKTRHGNWEVKIVGMKGLGSSYKTEDEAAEIYNKAAKDRWGKFARLNQITSKLKKKKDE